VDPFAQAVRIGRGMNLGNMLEAPNEGEWGVTVQREYLGIIREAGFDSVRIPVRWSSRAELAAPYTISPHFFRRVDEVLEWALEARLAVILNIHHYEEIVENPPAHLDRCAALWAQIAERYAHLPHDLMFELLNEPHDALDPYVNSLYATLIGVIRASNPNRTLLAGGPGWNSPDGLLALRLPQEERNAIGTFHMYSPFHFTHAGAGWVKNAPPRGAVWTGTQQERQHVDAQFTPALQWAERNGLPVHMGEFGAFSEADGPSRPRWTEHVVATAARLNVPWSYWEFCSGFGAYDATARAWRPELLEALVGRAPV
jgi:endoglucanase